MSAQPGAGPAASAASAAPSIRSRLFVALQYALPQHTLSRLVRAATRVRTRWFKNALTRGFLRLYRVDLGEAAVADPFAYGSFNEFFTRALAPAARPIAAGADTVTSPVDGTVSEFGAIDGDRLIQAKGRSYTLGELLAGCDWARRFQGGAFATIYLAPHDYHRIHMPCDGRLAETVFVPGRLFSVNAATARSVPRLFARNERVLTLFDGGRGAFALVLVGALNVSSIATVWTGDIAPAGPRVVRRLPSPRLCLAKGAELGRFNMGSTVILLFEPGRLRFAPDFAVGTRLYMGRAIGGLLAGPAA
ncbi:MAG: phosphatidylserine decarboxylase [Gammaproteobacteria bacterium]|nr:phosphatidylserine decarboxylase [Gammaproteobacteria bacterium]